MLFSILALRDARLWQEWVNLALGMWLVISPFVLDYSAMAGATWNHIIVGLLITADALLPIARPVPESARLGR